MTRVALLDRGRRAALDKQPGGSSQLRLLASRGMVAWVATAWATGASAQDQAEPVEDDEIIVTGIADRQLLLDARTETGSRLGLTARETPATIDILSQRQIQELGARTQVEALNRAPGVTASLTATSPGIPTLRGFSGGAVGLFYDGGRVATPALFTRATDSWLYERIEILKGPASVLFGEGALAGAINLVPKRPRLGDPTYSALATFGSFDTLRVAGDVNMPLTDTVAVRAIGSYGRTNGYVDDTDADFLATTFAVQLRPADALNIDFAVDYNEDSYDVADYGTPLVPLALARRPSDIVSTTNGFVIDRALRDTNFNVTDGILDSDTLWLRSRIRYDISDQLSFTNELSKYHSDRRFINAEIFTFQPRTGLIDRTSGIITHDLDYWIERAFVAGDFNIAGLRNRVTVGAEYSDLDFVSQRYFGNTTSVDPYAPVRGTFPGGSGAPLPPPNSFAEIKVRSIFGENALNLTPKWLVLGGGRYDWVDLDRRTIAASGVTTPFARDYKAFSWRVGTVYDLLPKTQIFAQYSRAIAPVGNLILLSVANSRFDLTTGRSAEGGIKSSFWDNRIDVTVAGYWIEQNNIITRDPANPTLSIQGGRQSSRGVELSMSAAVTERFRVDANYTALDARFDELIEAGGVSRKGNTPPRVPETVTNLFGFYSFDNAPVTLSAGIRRAGRFFTDNANTIRVKGYHGHYKRVTFAPAVDTRETLRLVLVQCGTPAPRLARGEVLVEVPVRSFATANISILGAAVLLGVGERLKGMPTKRTSLPQIERQIADGITKPVYAAEHGNGEQAAAQAADIYFTFYSAYPGANIHPLLKQLGVAAAPQSDHTEATPLGRAEWIKYLALFVNQEARANAIFADRKMRYERLAALARTAKTRPLVQTGYPETRDEWVQGGGGNAIYRLVEDAGGRHAWRDVRTSSSWTYVPMERLFERAAEADIWIGNFAPGAASMAELRRDNPRRRSGPMRGSRTSLPCCCNRRGH